MTETELNKLHPPQPGSTPVVTHSKALHAVTSISLAVMEMFWKLKPLLDAFTLSIRKWNSTTVPCVFPEGPAENYLQSWVLFIPLWCSIEEITPMSAGGLSQVKPSVFSFKYPTKKRCYKFSLFIFGVLFKTWVKSQAEFALAILSKIQTSLLQSQLQYVCNFHPYTMTDF